MSDPIDTFGYMRVGLRADGRTYRSCACVSAPLGWSLEAGLLTSLHSIALSAAGYSVVMGFVRDKQLRLSRSPGKGGNVGGQAGSH